MLVRRSLGHAGGFWLEPQHKCLDPPRDVLEFERTKFVERQIEPVANMIADGSRDTDAARRTCCLKPGRHIHRVTMQIRPIGNHVANVDAHTKPNGAIAWDVAVAYLHLLLHLHGAADRPLDAIEHNEQGVASGLDDHATISIDGRVDNFATQRMQPFDRSYVVQPDEATIADHVRMNDRDQLTPIERPFGQVRCPGH